MKELVRINQNMNMNMTLHMIMSGYAHECKDERL